MVCPGGASEIEDVNECAVPYIPGTIILPGYTCVPGYPVPGYRSTVTAPRRPFLLSFWFRKRPSPHLNLNLIIKAILQILVCSRSQWYLYGKKIWTEYEIGAVLFRMVVLRLQTHHSSVGHTRDGRVIGACHPPQHTLREKYYYYYLLLLLIKNTKKYFICCLFVVVWCAL